MNPLTGQFLLGAPVAVAAGAVSFLSPCVLPLVPGYLGYVSGAEAAARQGRRRVVLGAALFVLGFSVVFVGTSTVLAAVGFLLNAYFGLITRIAGVVVILLGLAFAGAFGPLQRRLAPTWRPRAGLIGAPLLGVIFAAGWTPCVGPTLFVIQAMALTSSSLGSSVLLATCYSLGLGVPFVLIALGFGWATSGVVVLRRHIRAINLAGSALLVAVGVLMVSGAWAAIVNGLQVLIGSYVPAI